MEDVNVIKIIISTNNDRTGVNSSAQMKFYSNEIIPAPMLKEALNQVITDAIVYFEQNNSFPKFGFLKEEEAE